MADPIETAAEAMRADDVQFLGLSRTWNELSEASREEYCRQARAALSSLAQHRDDIARAMAQQDGVERYDAYLDLADAVLAYLTGEAA